MPREQKRGWPAYLVDDSGYQRREYRCGLFVGDVVSQRREFRVEDPDADEERVCPEGTTWTVLPLAPDSPVLVRLESEAGLVITWEDSPAIFRVFNLVKRYHGNLDPLEPEE